ncbi:2-hydroxyacid dehydrogenase [Streptomyces zingiberis]|uniref:Hydroxyacid dehydrogenase n=1 Tax=Streptomyces zingiberis TaxID=2053010 RepID=A0ABX1BSM6_9ACTN|nr:2-hydroxyacid dehydrogenase [Streptomyces zingiberis]NJQ00711.1 hydroxyacid dehydrogenase [Streptomyces zingiberis]
MNPDPRPDGPTVVVADSNLRPLRETFEAALPPGAVAHWPDPADPDAVAAALPDADVLVSGVCTAAMAAAGKRLKLVHAAGAGVDKIDTGALPPGTTVANTFHHEDSIAEYAVASAVLLGRGFLRQDAALRRGVWDSPAHTPGAAWPDALGGGTVGFVGFGHIGARAWRRFRAFGARGVAVTRRGDTDAAAEGLDWAGTVDDLGTLLETADVVLVSVPLTEATTGLIDAAGLARMKRSAVLINVGRGPVVDEDALYAALRDAAIGGAALDVWYTYPASGNTGAPSRHPFHELPNVLMTPHSSGLTRQTFLRRAEDIAANIHRFAAGETPHNVVAVVR